MLTLHDQSTGIHPAPSAAILTTGPHDLDRRTMVDVFELLEGVSREDGVILETKRM
jgi:hypothetical protein